MTPLPTLYRRDQRLLMGRAQVNRAVSQRVLLQYQFAAIINA